jgi:hypothetical protein
MSEWKRSWGRPRPANHEYLKQHKDGHEHVPDRAACIRAANDHRRGGSLQGAWHKAIWEQLAQVLCAPAVIAFERWNIRKSSAQLSQPSSRGIPLHTDHGRQQPCQIVQAAGHMKPRNGLRRMDRTRQQAARSRNAAMMKGQLSGLGTISAAC